MKCLISIQNLSQSFGKEKVIKDFSYNFKKFGFYVLLGDSGSGKSTLLNLISGLIPFDEGTIIINNKKYVKQVENRDVTDFIAYISQDSRLIEYLTVYDNLKLCSQDDEKILEYVDKFKVKQLINKYPNEISGGERQRIILIQFLLLNKQIFLMDETSSSLDYQNKIELFKVLKELGKNKLIIFATHDKDITNYADEIVTVNKSMNLTNFENDLINVSHTEKPRLYPFIKKQDKYKRNIFSTIVLVLVFVVSILITFICSDIDNKMFLTALNMYDVNYLKVYIPEDYNHEELKEKYDISEIIYNYSANLPYKELNDGGTSNTSYELILVSLPSSAKDFKIADRLKEGTYFTKTKQVILGYDLANSLSVNPKNLIGKNIEIVLPDKKDNFEVVGILDKLTEDDQMYMSGGGLIAGEEIDSNYFINGKYFDKYINDDVIGTSEHESGKVQYFVFFENDKKLLKFYNDFNNQDSKDYLDPNVLSIGSLGESFTEQQMFLVSIAAYLYPAVVMGIIVVIAFYLQLKLIHLKYTEFNLGIYESLGFVPKIIKKATLRYQIVEVVKLFVIALIISLFLANLFNILNDKFLFTDYVIFSFNIYYIIGMFLLVIILAVIVTKIAFRHLKTSGWLNMSYKGRDLL